MQSRQFHQELAIVCDLTQHLQIHLPDSINVWFNSEVPDAHERQKNNMKLSHLPDSIHVWFNSLQACIAMNYLVG